MVRQKLNVTFCILQAAALKRWRAMQRQVLYTKPVTVKAGESVQVSKKVPGQ